MSRNPYGQRNYGGSCLCSVCGRVIGGLRGFDEHQINMTGRPGYDREYDIRCATDAELEARGLRQNERGWWVTEARFDRGDGTGTGAQASFDPEAV